MIRLIAVMLVALVVTLPTSHVASQGTPEASPEVSMDSADARAAAAAAVENSRLEAAGDFNGLYDRIHPDAHAVIPRAAAVGWFEEVYGALGPQIATVTGVQFAEWTWAVTGQTYPYTAIVSFTQPFAVGPPTNDVVRLVQDQTGEWRWFFGRNRAFVEEQIEKYVPDLPQAAGLHSAVDVAIEDLNAFWAVAFQAASRDYEAPVVVVLDSELETGCGVLDPEQRPAAYCSGDRRIYYATSFFSEQEIRFGDYAWVHILAHEWAHHVQYSIYQNPQIIKAFELQADCLAGVYARDAGTRGLLEPGDITHAVMVSAEYADNPLWPQDPTKVHGTDDERIIFFVMGYLDGILGCKLPIARSTSSPDGTAATDPAETRTG